MHHRHVLMRQVEFGAHVVILARSLEDLEKLPQHLKDSDVLKLTVAQAKGLEFEDQRQPG